MLDPSHQPALLLNADFRPISTLPLSLLDWKDAVRGIVCDKYEAVANYDTVIRSSGGKNGRLEMQLPSVVALKAYQNLNRAVTFTRLGVFVRDGYRCAYCGERFPAQHLTFDHVVPRSKMGKTSWTNIVSACGPCNLKKANKPLEHSGMKLLVKPYAPTQMQMNELGRKLLGHRPPAYMHDDWFDFVGIDRSKSGATLITVDDGKVFPTGMTDDDYWTVELIED